MTASFLIVSEHNKDKHSTALCDFLLDMGYCVQKTSNPALANEIIDSDPEQYYGVFLHVKDDEDDCQEVFDAIKNTVKTHNFPMFVSKEDLDLVTNKQSVSALVEHEKIILFDKIDQLQARIQLNNKIEEQIQKREHLAAHTACLKGTMNFAKFQIQSIEQAQQLAQLLASNCPQPQTTVVGICEILINAIEHGNLGIDYDQKTLLHEQGRWPEEVHRLLQSDEHCEKSIDVHFTRHSDKITIEVIDQGQGFDWRHYQEIDPLKMLHSHGRGIAIARALSFDSLDYSPAGNQVTCTIFTKKESS